MNLAEFSFSLLLALAALFSALIARGASRDAKTFIDLAAGLYAALALALLARLGPYGSAISHAAALIVAPVAAASFLRTGSARPRASINHEPRLSRSLPSASSE